MLGCHFKLTTFLKIKVTIKIMRYKWEIETQKDRLILGSNLLVTSSSVCLCGPYTFLSRKGVNTEFRLHYSNQICQEWSRTKIVFHFYLFLLWSSLVRLHFSLSRLPMNVSHRWFFSTKQESAFPGLDIFFHLIHFFYFLSFKVFPVRENATAAWHTKKRPTSSFTREKNTFAWKCLPFKLGTTKGKKSLDLKTFKTWRGSSWGWRSRRLRRPGKTESNLLLNFWNVKKFYWKFWSLCIFYVSKS